MHSLNRQKLHFSRSLERVQHAPCGVRHVSKRLFLGVTAFSTAVVWQNVHQGKVMGTAQEWLRHETEENYFKEAESCLKCWATLAFQVDGRTLRIDVMYANHCEDSRCESHFFCAEDSQTPCSLYRLSRTACILGISKNNNWQPW